MWCAGAKGDKLFLRRSKMLNAWLPVAGTRLSRNAASILMGKSRRRPTSFLKTVAILIAESITGFQ
jgi:hypothetical protein